MRKKTNKRKKTNNSDNLYEELSFTKSSINDEFEDNENSENEFHEKFNSSKLISETISQSENKSIVYSCQSIYSCTIIPSFNFERSSSFDILKTPLLALPYTGFAKDG